MKPLLFSGLLVSLLLSACTKDIQNEGAVRRGIMTYLSKRQDLTAMDVTVTKVAFRQSEADATVHFQAKNSTAAGTGLDMSYLLERKGNDWVVKGRASGSSHGANMPGTMPGAENPHGMGRPPGAMPGETPGTLPPGHPQVQPKPPGPTK